MKNTEITRAVYGDSHAFKQGVEVGRKETIEKACEWIKKYTYQDCLGVSPIARLKVGFSSVEELIDNFRKALL